MNILLTGGAGFIGSHTIVELRTAGHDVFVIDNFANSKPDSLIRVGRITGKSVPFLNADVCDVATCYCNSEKALRELGWRAEYDLEQMCRDSWNFQKNNPEGI